MFYKRWLLIILLILVVGIGYKITRIVLPAYGLWQDTTTLESLAQTKDPTTINPDELAKAANSAHENIRQLHHELTPFFPLFKKMGWFPVIGDEIAATPPLLEAGLVLSESGAILSQHIAAPILKEWQADSSQELLLLVAQTVDSTTEELPTARANLFTAEFFLNEANLEDLHPRLRNPLQRLQNRLPDARLALDTLNQMPEITALYGGERVYLIALQNEDELRATGGFLSAVGVVRFQNGQMAAITFQDSYTIDNPNAELFPPPIALQNFTLAERWVLRDANWSPDAPTAARDIREIYEANTGQKVDGVILLNQEAVVRLVSAIGTLTLPDFPEPITSANLRDYMRNAYSPQGEEALENWWLDRKQFIQVLFDAMMNRIQNEYNQIDISLLLNNLQSALDEGHITVNLFTLPGVQISVEQEGWHRPIALPTTSDFLMVVNSNLGFNKVNAVIQHSMEYHVSLTDLNAPFTQLMLHYTHPQGVGVECIHEARYGDSLAYQDMIERCYWDYVRVYTPQGIQLAGSSSHPLEGEQILIADGWNGQATRTQEILASNLILQPIAQFFLVEGGQSQTVNFTYTLPDSVISQAGETYTYHLKIQKQSGVVSTPTTVIIDLPLDATVLETSPTPLAISENKVVRWQVALRQDTELWVTFQTTP